MSDRHFHSLLLLLKLQLCSMFLIPCHGFIGIPKLRLYHHQHRHLHHPTNWHQTPYNNNNNNNKNRLLLASAAASTSTGSAEASTLSLSQQQQPQQPQQRRRQQRRYRQLLEFVEPTTNVTVILVGTMHYNPASIQLVQETIQGLQEEEGPSSSSSSSSSFPQRRLLGSVVIESCMERWNSTSNINKNNPTGSFFLESILRSEMRVACELAMSPALGHRPVVLGDQSIRITGTQIKRAFQETLYDLILPLSLPSSSSSSSQPSSSSSSSWNVLQGWKRIYDNITTAWEETTPPSSSLSRKRNLFTTLQEKNNVILNRATNDSDEEDDDDDDDDDVYLDIFSILSDPKLLLSAPVSFIKYPLSYLTRAPLSSLLVMTLLFLTDQLGTATTTTVSTTDLVSSPWTDYIGPLMVAVLETILFGRILFKEILQERNQVLAYNILKQCQIYSQQTNNQNNNSNDNNNNNNNNDWFNSIMTFIPKSIRQTNGIHNNNKNVNNDGDTIVYVPTNTSSITTDTRNNNDNDDTTTTRVVVAVIGMAHSNGIKRLLMEQRVMQ